MEQTYEWIRLAQAGDAAAKDNLLQENSGLIWSVVGRFRGRGEPEELNKVPGFEKSGVKEEEIDFIIATGYGRFSLEDADKQLSEISCHAKLPWKPYHKYLWAPPYPHRKFLQ